GPVPPIAPQRPPPPARSAPGSAVAVLAVVGAVVLVVGALLALAALRSTGPTVTVAVPSGASATIQAKGGPRVDCPPSCRRSYPSGTTVVIESTTDLTWPALCAERSGPRCTFTLHGDEEVRPTKASVGAA